MGVVPGSSAAQARGCPGPSPRAGGLAGQVLACRVPGTKGSRVPSAVRLRLVPHLPAQARFGMPSKVIKKERRTSRIGSAKRQPAIKKESPNGEPPSDHPSEEEQEFPGKVGVAPPGFTPWCRVQCSQCGKYWEWSPTDTVAVGTLISADMLRAAGRQGGMACALHLPGGW